MKFKEKKPEKTRIRADSAKRPGEQYPAFSLRYLSPKWCITTCNQEGMAAFADRIRILTQKSWMEILNLPKQGQGFEKIPRNQINAPIPSHVTDDVTHFWSFRFHGKAPMVGYKSGEVFHVLWFDPNFQLYDHGS